MLISSYGRFISQIQVFGLQKIHWSSLVDWENSWQNLHTSLWGLYILCSWVQISDLLFPPQPIGDELRSESPHFAGINRGQLSVAAHLPYTIHRRYTSFQRSSWTKSFLQFIRRETDTDPQEENFLLFVALSAMAILVGWTLLGDPIL